MERIAKHFLTLAGEYRVCSELLKRGVFATVTYGNHKSVDIYAICDELKLALKIEVKTSQGTNFVTSISQKKHLTDGSAAPAVWVLVQVKQDGEKFGERFFILTHDEICAAQVARNNAYSEKYTTKHGAAPDLSKGVDNVTIADVEHCENQWAKILDRMKSRPV